MDKELINMIKEANDILGVIGTRISIGKDNKARCPFHQDENPSLSINKPHQYFHCFGCGIGGDVISFVMLYEKMAFTEALRYLAEKAGIKIPNFSEEDNKKIIEERLREDILTTTAMFYHEKLTGEAKKHLIEKRHFSEEIIKHFCVGFADGGLREYLLNKRNFPLIACINAGVLKKNEDGQVKDYFYKRIIYPNFVRGRTVHITGRSFTEHSPKYMHLPGEIKHLYNEDALRNDIVIIVEGPTDCISLSQCGFHSVALLGNRAFKEEYLKKISRCKEIYICLDGDKGGSEGISHIGEILLDRAKIVMLPSGIDVNDYFIDHTKEDFDKLLKFAKNYIKYQIELIPVETNKTELPDKLDSSLQQISRIDKLKADIYLNEVIKKHFKLKVRELESYNRKVKEYRKEAKQQALSDSGTGNIYTAKFVNLVDIAEDSNGNPLFLVRTDRGLECMATYHQQGEVFAPPPKNQMPWLLPRADEVAKIYESSKSITDEEFDGKLYDDLVSHFKSISELPNDNYYCVSAGWVLHTYLLEPVEYSPVIYFFGIPEHGKTRTGKGMTYLAYRGIHVESLRDAYIVRVANNFTSTIFFDIKNLWKKAEKMGTEDILLQRYEKGAKVPRVLYPELGPFRDTVYFDIFGPTIIATNEAVDRILETRAICINMPETAKQFENDVKPEFALPLKARLVVFRFRHLGQALPDMVKPAKGRLGDILKPIQQIIKLVKPEMEGTFLELVEELSRKKITAQADSLEAGILWTILKLIDLGIKDIKGSSMPVKSIADTFNEDRQEKFKVTYQLVGRRLEAMGFQKHSLETGNAAIILDEKLLEQLKQRYGIKHTPIMPVTPVTTVSPVKPEGNKGITGDTGVWI
jgi:DNA primase catalytic core